MGKSKNVPKSLNIETIESLFGIRNIILARNVITVIEQFCKDEGIPKENFARIYNTKPEEYRKKLEELNLKITNMATKFTRKAVELQFGITDQRDVNAILKRIYKISKENRIEAEYLFRMINSGVYINVAVKESIKELEEDIKALKQGEITLKEFISKK